MGTVQTHLFRLGALAVACATTLAVAADTADAATPATGSTANSGQSNAAPASLSGLKARAAADVNDRVNALNAAIDRANAAKGLGSGQGTLVAYLGNDITPLQQLNTKIQGDTTYKQALADFQDIFTNFRVYVLVLPVAAIGGNSFRATNTLIPNLTTASTKAQAHVTDNNRSVLQPLIDDLNTQIAAATGANNGLADPVLAFTPAQWNANHDLLSPAKAQDQTSDTAVQRGRSDVQDIWQVLRGSTSRVGGGATATG